MSDNLGSARGSIYIDVSQPQTVPGIMQGVATGTNRAMGQINSSANQASAGISTMASAVRGLAGAFGISFGIQGVVQLAKMAAEAGEVATAFNRQSVAARSLAGSQEQLNYLLEAYDRASGGAVDKATAMANVTRLLATGFARTGDELEKFVIGVRGAAIAMGKTQDEIMQEVQLAIVNQSTKRLDQIGLGVAEVENRVASLRAANQGMSQEMAFQQAVLGLLNEKYGALAKSQEGAKTGMERAGTAAKNTAVTFGQLVGPILDIVGADFERTLTRWNDGMAAFISLSKAAVAEIQKLTGLGPAPVVGGGVPAWMTGVSKAANGPLLPDQGAEIQATKLDWSKGITELNNRTNEQLLQQNADYQRQRSDSERQFQTSTLRAAQDFAMARQREEQDLADSLARLHSDAARREARLAEDLGRSIGEAQANSEEKIADLRKDANRRLVELDEDYEKDRIKRARDLSDKLLDAAGDLNAKAVYEAQRNAARQEEEAKETHDDQREKAQQQLDERIEDERKNLAKSIAQQQASYERQLQDQREADARRETDMLDAFAKRIEQENIDYGIRLQRMAQDHADQMAEMDRAQGERITQIQTHAQQERDQLDDEHKRALDELQNHNSKWHEEIVRADNAALDEFKRLTNPVRVWLKDPTRPLVTPDMAGTSSVPGLPGSSLSASGASISRSTSMGQIVVNINGTNLNETQLEGAIVKALTKVLEEHTP